MPDLEDFEGVALQSIACETLTAIPQQFNYTYDAVRKELSNQDFLEIKNIVALKIANEFLDKLEVSCVEVYDRVYEYKFSVKALVEKERAELLNKINSLEVKNYDLKDKYKTLIKDFNKVRIEKDSLQKHLDKFQNGSFWQKLKMLFGKEIHKTNS